jgi:hypothetical protein
MSGFYQISICQTDINYSSPGIVRSWNETNKTSKLMEDDLI